MIIRLCSIAMSFFIVACCAAPESFIVQPKKPKESKSHVQEDIAASLMLTTKKITYTTEYASRLQRQLLEYGNSLLAQDKNSPLVAANVQKLQECRTALQEVSSLLDSCNKMLCDTSNKLHNLISVPAKK